MKASILIVGDVVNTTNTNPFIDSDLIKIIRDQDYSVCNFEAPIEGVGIEFPKAGPHLAQKKETIDLLQKAGFNLLLLANNHMYDFGEEGLLNTIKEAANCGLDIVGAGLNYSDSYFPFIKEINGLKIAFINASEAQFGVLDGNNSSQGSGYAWINHYLIDETIVSLNKKVDKIIVCAHAGLENYSIPLTQWRDRYKKLIDLGADCIIGSHPHVPQGFEIYKNKPIFYSLGNFYFDTQAFVKSPDYTYSVILKITKREMSFEFIFHHKENGKVRLTTSNETAFSLDKLNSQLNNIALLEQVYLHAYHKITEKYFASIYNSLLPSDSFMEAMKKIILKFVNSSKYKKKRELLLLHLLRNETYRWVTISAIEIINKQITK